MTRYLLKENRISFSVIIPTLNTRHKYLLESIYSVINQTYKFFEIIVVNNGRNDINFPDSFMPIKQIKTIYKAGSAQARNIGVQFAKNNYVAFLDDDDLWAQDYLENIEKHISRDNPDCLIGSLNQLKDEKILPFKNAHGKLNKDIIFLKNPGITGSTVVVKKEVFIDIGGYNPKLPPSEDKSLILELIKKKYKVVTVPESAAIIRHHSLGDRLTELFIVEGIFQFYHAYKNQMNLYQRLFNICRFLKYSWRKSKNVK